MNQTEQNLAQALGDYGGRDVARFHMPGHKGRGMGGFWRPELPRWDVTELAGTDDLHAPHGVILAAQQRWAKAAGARHTFFLVNGASAGVAAMLLALGEGERVLLGRDCHSSALSGAALAGLDVDFVPIPHHAGTRRTGVMAAPALEAALRKRPARGVLVTSPNYFGMCADLPQLAQVAHRHGALLLVDAAHGAHFHFSDCLPASPEGHGDMWVESAHKTLNALGQAALLHLGPGAPAPETVQRLLALVQTSSPSYLLMASLDWARYTAARDDAWTRQAERAREWGRRIAQLWGMELYSWDAIGTAGVADMDPTRLCVDVEGRGVSGYEAAGLLEQQGVVVEMADSRSIVCITTPADKKEWYQRLYEGLKGLPCRKGAQPQAVTPPAWERAMPLRQALFAPLEAVPLEECAGRIAAAVAGAYPPGNVAIAPGERISAQAVEYLLELLARGAVVRGVRQGRMDCVKE